MYKCRAEGVRYRLPLNDSVVDDIILAEVELDDEEDDDVSLGDVSNVTVRCVCGRSGGEDMMPKAMSRSEVRRQSKFISEHVQSGRSFTRPSPALLSPQLSSLKSSFPFHSAPARCQLSDVTASIATSLSRPT